MRAQGLWVFTVLSGLLLFGGLLLPAAFWAATRKRPAAVAAGFSRALVLAFGSSSSSAALPVRLPDLAVSLTWMPLRLCSSACSFMHACMQREHMPSFTRYGTHATALQACS